MNGRRERILVGYDGSVAGERALIWAANEAGRCDGELTVCHAWTPGTPVLPDDIAAVSVAHRHGERVLARGLAHARRVLGHEHVHTLFVAGSAGEVLCRHSRRADMVVVGSRGRRGLTGVLLGSVSSHVAAYASGPVVAVPGHRPGRPGDVVVGLDGSEIGGLALEFAWREARRHGVRLVAVCAPEDVAHGAPQLAEADVAHAVAVWRDKDPGTPVELRFVGGRARDVLPVVASGAELLVVGSRGGGRVRGLLGSTSQAVLHHAPCPVAVVHPR